MAKLRLPVADCFGLINEKDMSGDAEQGRFGQG